MALEYKFNRISMERKFMNIATEYQDLEFIETKNEVQACSEGSDENQMFKLPYIPVDLKLKENR